MSSVRRVTVVEMTPDGPKAQTLVKEKKKRRVSRGLKGMEKGNRRMLEAQVAFAETALDEHERLTEKRGDRWLTEGPAIVLKATRKAAKRFFKV
jgi:hypothetical protein